METHLDIETSGHTDDEYEAWICYSIGRTMIGMVSAADRCGHLTLRGHLHYQQIQPGTPGGDIVQWLHWMSASGDEGRAAVGRPDALIEVAELIRQRSYRTAMNEGIDDAPKQ